MCGAGITAKLWWCELTPMNWMRSGGMPGAAGNGNAPRVWKPSTSR